MLSVVALLAGFAAFAFAYWGYGKWFDRKIMESNPKKTTPARMYMDGIEFFPSNKYVMMGFQWKSIAALGPIIGPTVAMKWGWLPGLLWVIFGNTLIGWLHDYVGLMVSVKSEGASFGPLVYELISKRARLLLLSFISFYLLLAIGSYGMTVAVTYLAGFPQAPVAILAICIVSMFAGILTFKYKTPITYTTVLAMILMVVGVWVGFIIPVSVPFDPWLKADFWYFWVLVFCYLGAVTPVWLFLQPVNYLSFYLVYGTVIAVLVGVLVGAPTFNLPAYTTVAPLGMGIDPIWPIMFVTIACGAVSGWHALVGSAVSSKQLDNEADGLFVGGGAMLLEGILSLAAISTVAALTPAAIAGKAAPIVLIQGWSTSLGYLGVGFDFAMILCAIIVSLLALSVLHLNVRVIRFCLAELFGERIPIIKNMYVAAAIPCLLAWLLSAPRFGGIFIYVWTLWGGMNQLLAGINLLIATMWFVRMKKPSYFTGVPSVFMIGTTIVALILTMNATYIAATKPGVTFIAAFSNWLAVSIALLVLILTVVLINDAIKAYGKWKAAPAPTVAS